MELNKTLRIVICLSLHLEYAQLLSLPELTFQKHKL